MNRETELIESGKNYFGKNDYALAQEHFNKALEVNPDNPQAHCELGRIYYVQGKYSLAIHELERSVSLDQNNAFAYFFLGKCHKSQKEYNNAVEEFQKAKNLGYKDPGLHKELAELYRALNRYDLAAQELKDSFECDPENQSYYKELDSLCFQQVRLVQSYNLEGRYREALEEAERAAGFIPGEKLMLQNIILNEKEIAHKKISLSSRIRSLTVTLTNKCNLYCLMCKSRDKPWEIPRKTIEEIVSLFPYLERIMWQGGETFLYDGFKDLLKEANKFPMRKLIATNGLLIDEEVAEIMVKGNVELTFSVDGATKEVYEYIRRGASFEKLISNINLINEMRERLNTSMETRLNVLIMRANCHQIEDLLEFAKKYKFNRLFFNIAGGDFRNLSENIFYYNRDKEMIENIYRLRPVLSRKAEAYGISLENWLPSYEFLDNNVEEQGEGGNCKGEPGDKLLCHAPWQRLFIDCGGRVRPDCLCLYESYVGDVLENSLEEIWNAEKLKEYRKKIVGHQQQGFCNPDCIRGRVPEQNLKFV